MLLVATEMECKRSRPPSIFFLFCFVCVFAVAGDLMRKVLFPSRMEGGEGQT